MTLGWLGLPALASAQEVRYEFDDAQQFEDEGWFHNSSAGSSAFTDGTLVVDTVGYEEWILYSKPDSSTVWWNYVHANRGWWLETRVRLDVSPEDSSCLDGGPGLWIHDGSNLVKFTLRGDSAGLSYPQALRYDMNTLDDFHVYRIENAGGASLRVLIDGTEKLTVRLAQTGGGTEAITIGDLGGCNSASKATWDYLAYDTAAPGTEALDDDEDGIPRSRDLCPDDADDGADTDQDRVGDVCDTCPNDPFNDADQDGLCADEDICPNSPNNDDLNQNGICDAEECGPLPGGLNIVAPGGAAPAPYPCGTIVPISDPVAPSQTTPAPARTDETGALPPPSNSEEPSAPVNPPPPNGTSSGALEAPEPRPPTVPTGGTPSADPQPSGSSSATTPSASTPPPTDGLAGVSDNSEDAAGCVLAPGKPHGSSKPWYVLALLGLGWLRRSTLRPRA